MARKGSKVVIVDTDFPRPSIYKVFKISNSQGLTNVLMGEKTIQEVTVPSGTDGLDLIPTGPKPPSTSLLFESQLMRDFIKELETMYDFIIFDTPPILTINDPVILGAYVDKTILVVSAGEISRQVVKEGVATLNKSHHRLLGVVLNKFKSEGSHYYSYYYYYSYYTSEEKNAFKRLLNDSLAIVGLKRKRKRRKRRTKVETEEE
jgi:capsular exopolysaccharide synthesis family protein